MKRIYLFIAILGIIINVSAQTLSPKVSPTMGSYYTAGGFSLSVTLGETITPTDVSGNYELTQGFQQPEVQILTGTITGSPLCAGATVSVPYTAQGIFSSNNVFIAQLSNATGSFASPVTIGTHTGNSSGIINATIPINTISGIGYRIRVTSNTLAFSGKDNGVNITINSLPAPPEQILGNANPCNNSIQTYSVAPVLGATSYLWTIPNLWTGTSTTNSITVNVINASGNVSCKAVNVCPSPATLLPVVVNPNPVPVIIGPTGVCQGLNVILTDNIGVSWLWNTNSTNPSINITTTGLYSLTVTDANGCTGSANHAVTVYSNPLPVITGTGITNYCSGNPATLNVALFTQYNWSTGATTQSVTIPGNNPNTYSVTVSNSHGCTGTTFINLSNACPLPTSLGTTNIARTSAMATWLQPACVYGYNIRIRKQFTNAWATYSFPPNSHYTFSALIPNTPYEWQIQNDCNASLNNVSGYSPSQYFTTLASMEGGASDNAEYAFNVYPNPTRDQAIVSFTAGTEDVYNIRLIDVTGRIIQNVNYTSVIGENQYQLNVSTVAKGVYTIILQNGSTLLQSKIVVQ